MYTTTSLLMFLSGLCLLCSRVVLFAFLFIEWELLECVLSFLLCAAAPHACEAAAPITPAAYVQSQRQASPGLPRWTLFNCFECSKSPPRTGSLKSIFKPSSSV